MLGAQEGQAPHIGMIWLYFWFPSSTVSHQPEQAQGQVTASQVTISIQVPMLDASSAFGATESSKVTQQCCRLPLAALSCGTSDFLSRRPAVDLWYITLCAYQGFLTTGCLNQTTELGPSAIEALVCWQAGHVKP